MAVLEARLSKAEADQADAAEQADELVNVGLARINDVLLPSVIRIQKLTSLGFLLAPSSSSVALSVSQKTFILDAGDQRDLFTPSAYVAIEATGDPDTRAVAHVLSYDPAVGFLKVDILAVFGSALPRTDWIISASPGVTEISRIFADRANASGTQAAAAALSASASADMATAAKTSAAASAQAATDKAAAAADSASAAKTSADSAAASAASAANKAPLASPAFTGVPTAPTAALNTNTTQIATMAALKAMRDALVNGSGTALDTLKELADALGGDANFATTVSTALGNRLRGDAAGSYTDAQVIQFLANLNIQSLAFGQCRLVRNTATQLLLKPANGNLLFINGSYRKIPVAGIAISNAGLTANTQYYVYASWTGTVISLEFSPTGRATDTTYGHQIKSGDPTRTLVGMVFVDGNSPGQFVDTSVWRGVASWFNRKATAVSVAQTSSIKTASTNLTSISQLSQLLVWGDENSYFAITGYTSNDTAPNWTSCAVAIDGSANGVSTISSSVSNNALVSQSPLFSGVLGDGTHNCSILGAVSAGTGTFNVSLQGQVFI